MKTTLENKCVKYIAVAVFAYSVAVLPAGAGCYKDGEGDPCLKNGDIVSTGESMCLNLTGEGPILLLDYWYTIAQNSALSEAVRELNSLDMWGSRTVVETLTYNEVTVSLTMPDPDDCSQTITIPEYATDVISCPGTKTSFTPICYN